MSGSWDDLKPRVISGVVMAVVGAAALWAGGIWFMALVAICCGAMIWELARMCAPDQGAEIISMGVIAAMAVVLTVSVPVFYSVPILLGFVGASWSVIRTHRMIYALYALLIMVGGCGFILIRQDAGLIWMLWLILIVVASDMAGYIAGRLLGGPKFWPKVSPKKTWSGTVAGWIAAALVGVAFIFYLDKAENVVLAMLLSVLLAFAAQMGDIAESAVKRKCGIKDSSNLIPGHGGFMDRLDAMLGASALVVVVLYTLTISPVG